MYNKQEVIQMAQMLGVTFDKFSLDDLIIGVNTEMEHGAINPETNITNNDLELTMKIALAHLNEFPDYYNNEYGLPAFEANLKKMRAYY